MSRLTLNRKNTAQMTMEAIYSDMERRIKASPLDLCPVDITLSTLNLCETGTCGKCTPCRVGLRQLKNLLELVLSNEATMETLEEIEYLAHNISISADCAIGIETAKMVLKGLKGFRDDYESHIKNHRCKRYMEKWIPCVAKCPANVDVPGYIALVREKRYNDAVKLIRKDNPFPTACALVCEHPCEEGCRRGLLDAPIDIRRLKRFAVENADTVPAPKKYEKTGKKVAIIGGGPAGLTCAYFLQLMGHECTIYESHKKLGGMLVYGIPSYRLPREQLQKDIDCILSTGVKVVLNTEVDDNLIKKIENEFDATYIAIGAQMDKKIGIEGSRAEGVLSAVEFLGQIGDDKAPDLTGKTVCVIGGGNVAMDCTRSAIRLGAKNVKIVYRRRKEDMTAQLEEIDGAIAEGAELLDMEKPLRIVSDSDGNVSALVTHPQMVGKIENGRMCPTDLNTEDKTIDTDVIIIAIGQSINAGDIAKTGISLTNRGVIETRDWAGVAHKSNVFAGGDCVTGPKTAIMAINAGKVAAANIDYYLGYDHKISVDIDIPERDLNAHPYFGRVQGRDRAPLERKCDFDIVEKCISLEEAEAEAKRCLQCDYYGCGSFKGGRNREW